MTGHAELRNFVDGELQGLADRLDHEVVATRIEVTSVRVQLCREEGRHTNARRLTPHHTTGTFRGAGFAVVAAHLHQRLESTMDVLEHLEEEHRKVEKMIGDLESTRTLD